MKKLNVKFFCTDTHNGTMNFYLDTGKEQHFLFQTRYYSAPIFQEYQNGQDLNAVFSNTKETRQQKIKERIIRCTKYLDREYSLGIFETAHRKAA